MKLSEARYHSKEKIVVLVDDLPFSPILEQTSPFIEPRSGVLVLSADHLDPYKLRSYTGRIDVDNPRYSKRKHEFPWQAELAGTERQIKYFLQLFFPNWSTDGELQQSDVWRMEDVERAANHAAKKEQTGITEHQVSRILEAKYFRSVTADQAYDIYEAFLKSTQQRKFDDIVVVEIDWSEANDYVYAVMYLWALDSTEEEALAKTKEFMQDHDLPFTNIDADSNNEPNRRMRWHVTAYVAEYVKGAGDPLAEAQYYRSLSAGDVFDIWQEKFNYRLFTSDEDIQIADITGGPVNIAIPNSPESAELHLIVSDKRTADEAKEYTARYLEKKDAPFQWLTSEPTGDRNEFYVTAHYTDVIKEAQYAWSGKTTAVMRHQVYNLYKKHSSSSGRKSEPYIQVTQRKYGDYLYPIIGFWYRAGRLNKEQAEELAKQYMEDNDLPYTTHEYTRNIVGLSDIAVVFSFGKPKDNLPAFRDVTEARYAGKYSVEDVAARYSDIRKQLRDETDGYPIWPPVVGEQVLSVGHTYLDDGYEYTKTKFAAMVMTILTPNRQDAERDLKAFIKEFNVPYNHIRWGTPGSFDNKTYVVIEYHDKPALVEARQAMPSKISPQDVKDVYKLYKQYVTVPDEDETDFIRKLFQIWNDPASALDEVNDEPAISAHHEITEDGYSQARLRAAWTKPAPTSLDPEREKHEMVNFVKSLKLPYTDIESNSFHQEIDTAPLRNMPKNVGVQMSEVELIFRATDK